MKGRIIGVIIGFLLFNVIGAIIGYLIGNELDKEDSQKQQHKTAESLKSKSKVDDRIQTNNKQENHELKQQVKVAKEVEHSIKDATQAAKREDYRVTPAVRIASNKEIIDTSIEEAQASKNAYDLDPFDSFKILAEVEEEANASKVEIKRTATSKLSKFTKFTKTVGTIADKVTESTEKTANIASLISDGIEAQAARNVFLLSKIENGNNLDDIVKNACNSGLLKYSELKPDWASYSKILKQNNISALYHFTSSKNIPQIKQSGGLLSWYASVTRNNDVSIYGGDSLSRNLDKRFGNHDYVHLSFCDDHPMSYKLKQAGEHVVWLEISPVVILLKDTIFSDINAADSNHHQGGSISDLKRINFDATKMHYLQRNDINFKPHQAEVMVKTFLPKKYIINLESI